MNRSYYIFTLGCQMNVSDSQRIAQKLDELGYQSAPEDGADLVIVNACSVRQKALDRIWGKIKKWQKENKKILITGCVLPADKEKFDDKNIGFFNIKDLSNLEKCLDKHYYFNNNLVTSSKDGDQDYFHIKPKTAGRIAYIPIMTGCDNFCSYCAVPYTRGREISRSMEDIIAEVKRAIESGTKEIWLLGQNVNSYGIKSKIQSSNVKSNPNIKFIKLLKTIDNLPGNFQFNFISSNPNDMSDELIKTFANLKKWPRELHLAMQSGDDEILKKMNRKYTSGQFLALISKIKNQISKIKISTDIIVGFPGETREQFENTVKICQKIGFAKAYIAQYSPRPGTAAAKLTDGISAAEKKRRWKKLDQLINR